MIADAGSKRFVFFAGLLAFAAQLYLAYTYYLERTATYDPAFFSFLMIDSGDFEAVLGRYGTYLSQFLPWVTMKLGGDLESFLRSYSLSFIVLYVLFFLITLFVVKSRKAALAMVLCCTVSYHYSFYYSTAELYQGLALLCLLYGILERWRERPIVSVPQIAIALLLYVWISFYHQILFIPLFFMLGFLILSPKGKGRTPRQLIVYGLLLAWGVFRILYFEKSSYEANRMVTMDDFVTHTPRFFELPSWGFFRWEINEMTALLTAMVTAGMLMAFRKQVLRMLLFGAACIGFLYLVVITDHDGQSPVMYENYYTVFGFFASVVLGELLLDRFHVANRDRIAVMAGTALLVLLGVMQINKGHRPFSRMVEHYAELSKELNDAGVRKGYISSMNHSWDFSWMSWPVPFSTALISSVRNNGETTTLFVAHDLQAIKDKPKHGKQFYGPEWHIDWFTSDNLNADYFDLPESEYTCLTTWDSLDHTRADSIELKVLDHSFEFEDGSNNFLPMILSNHSSDTLNALQGEVPLRITCASYLRTDDGQLLLDGHTWAALEMDLPPGRSRKVHVVVEKPAVGGDYELLLDLRSEFYGIDWGKGERVAMDYR